MQARARGILKQFDGTDELLKQLQDAGFRLAEGKTAALAEAADTEPQLRAWLLEYLKNPNNEPWVRLAACRVIGASRDDVFRKSAFLELLDWMDKTPPGVPQEEEVRREVGDQMIASLLLMDLRDQEVLGMMARARRLEPHYRHLGDWRDVLKAWASEDAQLVADLPAEERVLLPRRVKRAKALLECAEGAEPAPGPGRPGGI
jgi:hypothetical protein